MVQKSPVLTQVELFELLNERFGPDPMHWAFLCPACGDVATGQDFKDAGKVASELLGQECIGRSLGVLRKDVEYAGRGCDWCAYGLFRGPWTITTVEGKTMYCFPVADAKQPA